MVAALEMTTSGGGSWVVVFCVCALCVDDHVRADPGGKSCLLCVCCAFVLCVYAADDHVRGDPGLVVAAVLCCVCLL